MDCRFDERTGGHRSRHRIPNLNNDKKKDESAVVRGEVCHWEEKKITK